MARKYFKELRLQQFRSFVLAGRFQSFTAAARELKISRTSVWQQIRALEEDFCVELLVVVDHQPKLTTEGEHLCKLLAPMVNDFDTIKETFLCQMNRVEQKLVIATTSSLLHHELREPTAYFRKAFPNVSLSFVDRTSLAAAQMLTSAKADLAIIGRIKEMANESSLSILPLMDCRFYLACHKGHELARKRKVGVDDLVRYSLILPSAETNSRIRINSVLEKERLNERLRVALESYSPSVLLAYAKDRLGIALLSISPRLVAGNRNALYFHDMSHVFGSEEVILATRNQRFELRRPHVDEFSKLILSSNRTLAQKLGQPRPKTL